MTGQRVYIAGAGIISPLGRGLRATEKALWENRSAIEPLQLFSLLQNTPLPVGQIHECQDPSPLPRTHRLARVAAAMALADCPSPPDVVILGTTTGGILTTEQLLREDAPHKELYRYHGLATVAEDIADQCQCTGPALTVSTACSSGAVALTLGLKMLRAGKAKRILVGGVDALCRLTYFGFHALQLVDRAGCRPLDVDRQGLAVAEGAAFLLLTTVRPDEPLAEMLGAGLSCDAYHPAAPHPEGRGAFRAMESALADADLTPADIDYINLHGTGTPENDQAEAKAITSLFPSLPPLSSIKGAMGHSLAAAGAIEAVVAALAVSRSLIPANTGCRNPDPALKLIPVTVPCSQPVKAVLSNSFGFGGNNGSLVIGRPDTFPSPSGHTTFDALAIHGSACLTGAGAKPATLASLGMGASTAGMMASDLMAQSLPPRLIRRLKRLARMSLALAVAAHEDAHRPEQPAAVFMGTGWGALSETYDFLDRLTESAEQFPSPTDFVGSVHNGPASQVAILFEATGANITASAGDYSFEQALLAADVVLDDSPPFALVMGADEGHDPFSSLLDPSIAPGSPLADGGGALYLSRDPQGAQCLVRIPFYQKGPSADVSDALIDVLGGPQKIQSEYALVLAGIPAALQEQGTPQLEQFLIRTDHKIPVCRYRAFTGEFASASAVAAVMAVSFLAVGKVPGALVGTNDIPLDGGKKILVLGTGRYLTAMEFFRP